MYMIVCMHKKVKTPHLYISWILFSSNQKDILQEVHSMVVSILKNMTYNLIMNHPIYHSYPDKNQTLPFCSLVMSTLSIYRMFLDWS